MFSAMLQHACSTLIAKSNFDVFTELSNFDKESAIRFTVALRIAGDGGQVMGMR